MRPGLTIKRDNMPQLLAATRALTENGVFVGIPQSGDAREDGKLGNADIGYLMENGIPERNVPARPHLVPGARDAQARITDLLRQGARLAMEGRTEAVMRALNAVGLTAQSSIRARIRAGIPPPLADSTIRARARRGRKGAKRELARRAAGGAAGTTDVTPLIDTGQYIAAITYVIRRLVGRR